MSGNHSTPGPYARMRTQQEAEGVEGGGDLGLQQPSYGSTPDHSFSASSSAEALDMHTLQDRLPTGSSPKVPPKDTSHSRQTSSPIPPATGPCRNASHASSERGESGDISRGASPASFETAEDESGEGLNFHPVRPVTATPNGGSFMPSASQTTISKPCQSRQQPTCRRLSCARTRYPASILQRLPRRIH